MLLAVLLTAAFMGLQAQDTDNAEARAEVKASIAKMQRATTPCNGGKEVFKDFIVQFNADSAFMESRLRITPAEREEFGAVVALGQFEAKMPFLKKDGDTEDYFYQFWGPELQFAKVYLTCSWVDSFYTHVFEWTRGRDGLWYLTHIDPGE